MRYHLERSTLALLVTVSLIFAPTTQAGVQTISDGAEQQESKEEKKFREQQEKRQKQEQERKEREEKARVQEMRKYQKLSDFAQDEYNRNPEFRDEVDKAYLDLQAQHALQAYQINTTRTSELIYPESEDQTFKIRRVLYDNPWVQDYVNRVGQRLVPPDSDKLYAFKVVYHPIPYAYTLSTGTVLISTGMISLLDNEAQLAYVLAHELAHVYKDHWKLKVMMLLAEEEYNKRQEKKRVLWSAVLAAAGAGIGAAVKGAEGTSIGAVVGLLAGYAVGSFFNRKIGIDWESAQENEADDFALRATLEMSYDAQEVTRLYQAMQQVARFDERVQLGFLGHHARLRERTEQVNKMLQGPLQGRYQELLKAGKLIGTTPEYSQVMAELKRDNGIEAYNFDMFEMARRNLQQAVSLRSDDSRAAFYYGRVLQQVGRTKEESEMANQYLLRAIQLDAPRQGIAEAHLQRALLLMNKTDPASRAEAIQALKDYLSTYQKIQLEGVLNGGGLPPNVGVIYDFMRLMGEKSWKPTPTNCLRFSTCLTSQAISVTATSASQQEAPKPVPTQSNTTPTTKSAPTSQRPGTKGSRP